MLDVHTVGAGGGSIARVDEGGALLVGPESAGADPGPACYGTGSAVTVTDANLALGRLDAEHFLGGRMTLDTGRMRDALGGLADRMGCSLAQAAAGVVRVANANMEAAIRRISVERGHDPRDFSLVAYGGAGPLHACELATELRIPRVLIPLYPGVLSAFGMLAADVVKDYSRSVVAPIGRTTSETIEQWFAPLEERAARDMADEGFALEIIRFERSLDLRYLGQSYELSVAFDGDLESAAQSFHELHGRRFGHSKPGAALEIVNVRLRAVTAADKPELAATSPGTADAQGAVIGSKEVAFGETAMATLYDRARLEPGNQFSGPAIVFQFDTTTVIPPEWEATVDDYRNLLLVRTFA
jgi:N-methylhydantoinase A